MALENELRTALERVKATEEMKERTLAHLAAQRRQRCSGPVGRRVLAAACAALALLAGVRAWRGSREPVAYVSVDVNPSVELALDRRDRVVSATAYNEDGAAVLEQVELEGASCGEALETLLTSEAMAPYLTGSYALTVTVAAGSEGEEGRLLAVLAGCPSYQRSGGQIWAADLSTLAEAHHCGMSFGKYAAGQVLQSYDSTVTDEDCHQMTMAQLQERIHACQGGESETTTPSSGHHSGGHHGGHE